MAIGLAAKTVCISGVATYIAQVIPGVPEAGQLGTMGALIAAIAWLVKALADARKRGDEKDAQFLARLDSKDKQLEAKSEQIIAMTGKVTEVITLAMEAVKESRATDTQVIAAIAAIKGISEERAHLAR